MSTVKNNTDKDIEDGEFSCSEVSDTAIKVVQSIVKVVTEQKAASGHSSDSNKEKTGSQTTILPGPSDEKSEKACRKIKR